MVADSQFWEAYRHPEWQKKRLEIMQRDGFSCKRCGSKDDTLNVHHGYYLKDHKPWEYPNQSLHTLCEICHKIVQDKLATAKTLIGSLSIGDIDRLIGYAAGLVVMRGDYCFDVRSLMTAGLIKGVADALEADTLRVGMEMQGILFKKDIQVWQQTRICVPCRLAKKPTKE